MVDDRQADAGDRRTGGDRFRIDGIDHVELHVPDPRAAARWYREVLGLRVREEYDWFERGVGPLMIAGADGTTKLALFEGDPGPTGERDGFERVAFGTDGPGFLSFVDRVADRDDVGVDRGSVVDHDLSFSAYFTDPHGYRFEVTTEDYGYVAERR